MPHLSSALFIDYDNIFLGLFGLHRTAAFAFAEAPDLWVEALRQTPAPGANERRFLVRRAYVNPNAWVSDEHRGNENGRVYLSKFRPELVRAGFEVVDCPALTSRTKNAADIRIVIDVMKLLDRPVRYDEIVIASGDADFTPLLHEIRAADRRVVVIAAGGVAPAYRAVADVFIDDEGLIGLTAGPLLSAVPLADDSGPTPAAAATQAGGEHATGDPATLHSLRATVEQLVRTAMEDSAGPVNLARLGSEIYARVDRSALSGSNWFGVGGLKDFLTGLDPTWQTDQHHAWDPQRHTAPPSKATSPGASFIAPAAVGAFVKHADLPALRAAAWPHMFAQLAVYSHAHHDSANIGEASAYVRDQMAATDTPVGRAAIGAVIRQATYGGAPLSMPQQPEALLEAVIANMEDRMEAAGQPASPDDVAALRAWLQGSDTSEPQPNGA